jgi:hypothetical protein
LLEGGPIDASAPLAKPRSGVKPTAALQNER